MYFITTGRKLASYNAKNRMEFRGYSLLIIFFRYNTAIISFLRTRLSGQVTRYVIIVNRLIHPRIHGNELYSPVHPRREQEKLSEILLGRFAGDKEIE